MNRCLVTGYLYDGGGYAMPNVLVTAFPDNAPFIMSSTGQIVARTLIETITSSTGYFAFSLLQNVEYCISIKELGYKEIYKVPTAATATMFYEEGAQDNGDDAWDIIPIGATSTGAYVSTTEATATTASTTDPTSTTTVPSGSTDPDNW